MSREGCSFVYILVGRGLVRLLEFGVLSLW